MERIIIDYITDELITDPDALPIQADSPLMDSNTIDSVAFLNLIMFLEERFGITIADADLTRKNFETVEAICVYVQARQPEPREIASW
ncbi:MAG TPA: acyl carrier protein [Ktedonobacterales bacterium]